MWARDAIAAGSFCDAGPQRVISATTKSRSENAGFIRYIDERSEESKIIGYRLELSLDLMHCDYNGIDHCMPSVHHASRSIPPLERWHDPYVEAVPSSSADESAGSLADDPLNVQRRGEIRSRTQWSMLLMDPLSIPPRPDPEVGSGK